MAMFASAYDLYKGFGLSRESSKLSSVNYHPI